MKPTSEQTAPRIDKTIEWLNQSRDQWKEKCLLAKTQLKRQTLSTKRLRDGRHSLKAELKSMRKHVEMLQAKLEEQNEQIIDLKKKL